MNTIFKRTLTLMLALLMAVGVVFTAVSCAETSDDPATETTGTADTAADGSDTAAAETEDNGRHAYDTVEKEKFNRNFHICNREGVEEDMKNSPATPWTT